MVLPWTVFEATYYLLAMEIKRFFIYVGLLAVAVEGTMTCLDESGSAVDWYILLKHPIDSGASNPLLAAGLGYVYITSQSSSTGWVLSSKSIADVTSFPGRTLGQLYGQYTNDITYIQYNDEKPDDSTSSAKGHAKGVASFTSSEGFWLIHSVPKYPPEVADGYSFPPNGDNNGQSFICISLNANQANNVGIQLRYTDPYIYGSKVGSWATSDAPDLVAAINGEITTGSSRITLTTKAGFDFQSFAKYRDFGQDLYDAFVAPSLGTALYAQTWQNGAGAMPSYCSGQYDVENVDLISISAFGTSYTSTKDHSKWAVSKSSTRQWACVGDINRMDGQLDRGGGTACLDLGKTWTAFFDSVVAAEAC